MASTKKSKGASSKSARGTSIKLIEEAAKVRKMAYAPYSKFRVGAALLTDKGLFTGCNVENASYGGTVCAERVAVGNAIAAGARKILEVAVVAEPLGGNVVPPCGLCLQVLAEFCDGSTPLHLSSDGRAAALSRPFDDFLPHRFGKIQLGK